jgi:phosphonate degradation associated HDIG domain protein
MNESSEPQLKVTSENVVGFIADIFQRKGADSYLGESVTMSQHMLQCAYQAEKNGADDEIIAASLLHDIGHYTSEFPADMVGEAQDNFHEEAGARLLAPFFLPRVVACVRYHVPAKRYLCVIDQTYYDDLSEASKHTLALQGGLMNPEEMKAFAALPHLDDILQVRRWDDLAKDPLQETPSFSYYQPILKRLVKAGKT